MTRNRSLGHLGSVCFVLHTHLPWVAHHGSWPVGEEWLHQAWAQSYRRIITMLERFGERGRRDLLTLGVTPVLAAQLDDPYCLRSHHAWLGDWQLRAIGLAGMREGHRRAAGQREYRLATEALADFEDRWRHGASPLLRRLADAGIVEILGGPLSHTFTPDLPDDWATGTLRAGLHDARLRLGSTPSGIWTPECAYRPGMPEVFVRAGVDHLMLEGPTMLSAGATTDAPWLLADTDIRVVGRDLPLAYRVWSPRRGYPGDRWYREFHAYDHEWGMKIQRVTSHSTPPEHKAPYDPERAALTVRRDAQDFVNAVRDRLLDQRRAAPDRPGLAVVAYDTELFGHWWHEGPEWLALVLDLLPEAGITPRSLRGALEHHGVAGRVHPGPGSWGSGKDFRVWNSPQTEQLRHDLDAASARVRSILARADRRARDRSRDQLLTSLLLALASDWVFMVSKDSAADYARARIHGHLADVHAIADEIEAGSAGAAATGAGTWRSIAAIDRPWGHLDARTFAS